MVNKNFLTTTHLAANHSQTQTSLKSVNSGWVKASNPTSYQLHSFSPLNLIPSASYLVVILAGPGEDLFPLINNQPINHHQNDQPQEFQSSKATLPLLNRPIVEFILDWIQDSNLNEILILGSESQRTSLNSVIKGRKTNPLHSQTLQIRLECIPDVDFFAHGTAGTLRWAINRALIKTAFVLLPCDLYFQVNRPESGRPQTNPVSYQTDQIYNRDLLALVERHRTHQNLLTSVFYERHANPLDLKDGPSLSLITLDPRSGILLNIQEMDGFGSEIEIRMKMLNKFPATVLSSSLVPAHVFICSAAVLDLLAGLPQLTSFKHQFVPWLAKNQWQPGLLQKIVNPTTKLDPTPDPLVPAWLKSTTYPEPLDCPHKFIRKGINTPITAASTPTISHNFSSISLSGTPQMSTHGGVAHQDLSFALDQVPNHNEVAFRCDYVIWRASDGFVCRANSVGGYGEANRAALKFETERRPAVRSTGPPPPGTGIAGADSLIGPQVNLMDKSSVKKSIVGRACQIGKMSKVVNSVLMERVTLGEHVKIDNCVISSSVTIGDRVELKDCEVEPGTIIESDFTTKGEKIGRC
ncbi:hypothetical protein O181_001233 [Austropuccinia psidii MF-1]|uniref:Translation initiation factor eIF2B subunit gamma n=1 Tax=Austropuccinia psidii MF-1 TaxID=1389203 RepID=A0A9Q3BAD4_9BASI|nr:hypothetical protein [Austropuccinia psidii MF-1]